MSSVTVTLPDALRAFIDREVEAEGYANAADYIRELVRRERDRVMLRALLMEGPDSGPPAAVDDEWFASVRATLRSRGGPAAP